MNRAHQPLLLGLAFAILLAIAGTSIYLVERAADDTDAVTRTLDVLNKANSLLLNVRRAESAQRGYLLAGQAEYLDEYRRTSAEVMPALSELNRSAAQLGGLRGNLPRAEELVRSKIDEMNATIEFASQGRLADAQELFRSGLGRGRMESLRTIMERIIDSESRLLVERVAASKRTGNWLLITTLAGTLLIALAGGLSVLLVQRSNRARDRALTELAATNANLETIVQHRTADLTEANEEIQRFAYIVSHDLRSPLVNIMGFTAELDALRNDLFEELRALRQRADAARAAEGAEPDAAVKNVEQVGKDFDEALGFIKASITKMDRLINAVLRLSREGRREFKPERLNVTEMLQAIAASVAHQANEANATITVGDLPEVTSDRLALEQVFSNLVDNAVKYLRRDVPGRIEIIGRTTPAHVVYEVRDNGRGIDPADHQRVFDLFRRAGAQDRPGEGIGLAHVRALVRRLGGIMGLTSQVGQGSTFTVTLPRRWSIEQRKAA